MRVVFEFMLFEAGAFFGFFVAALLNAARAGQTHPRGYCLSLSER